MKLTTKTRKALPAKEFAGPARSFPIPDVNHARKALQLDTHKAPAVRAQIAAKVHSKFPTVDAAKAPSKPRKQGITHNDFEKLGAD